MLPTLDAAQKRRKTRNDRAKQKWERVRMAENSYAIKLRKLARTIGDIVGAFPAGDPQAAARIEDILRKYADMITPWAEAVAAGMLADVSRRDEAFWARQTELMGAAMRREIMTAPTGSTLRLLQAEQVKLIRSIPLEAAQRVHKLTEEGLISSARYDGIVQDIRRTTGVTESRATLIARTEVGRASTNLAQARALHVGSEGYIWRTARDSVVRKSHKRMEGKYVRWSAPPTLDKLTGHAGCIPNCRCYPEIVLPEAH